MTKGFEVPSRSIASLGEVSSGSAASGDTEHAPWQVLASHEVYSAPPWLRLTRETVALPDGRIVDDYHRLELPDFVVVYPETTPGRVILERQYRHGPRQVVLTLPAGAVDAGEAPLAAAQRELLEETGYAAAEWHSLGSYTGNGSYGCGRAHFFLALGCVQAALPQSGDLEQTSILEIQEEDLMQAAGDGKLDLIANVATIMLAAAKLRALRNAAS